MNIWNNLTSGYQQLWKLIIRPPRLEYSLGELGPDHFETGKGRCQRTDYQLKVRQTLKIQLSLYKLDDCPNAPVVVYLHGNSSSRQEAASILKPLLQEGIHVCAFDAAGCGRSDGEYISLGYWESKDLRVVVNDLKVKGYKRIALWGRSMGAATSLMLEKPEDISALVLDSPFSSLKLLAEQLCKKHTSVPGFVLSIGMKIISGTIKEKANFSIYDLNPIAFAAKCKMPAFFLSAEEDSFVPSSHTKSLYQVYKGRKELRLVEGNHNSRRPYSTVRQIVAFLKQIFFQSGIDEIKLDFFSQPIELVEIDDKQEAEIVLGNQQQVIRQLGLFSVKAGKKAQPQPESKTRIEATDFFSEELTKPSRKIEKDQGSQYRFENEHKPKKKRRIIIPAGFWDCDPKRAQAEQNFLKANFRDYAFICS